MTNTIGQQLTRVLIEDIKIDTKYQREQEREHISRITRTWENIQWQPPVVALRADDTMYAVDGQQRLLAALAKGFKYAYVLLARSTGQSWESGLFVKMNSNTKRIDPPYKHRALVVEGDKVANQIEYVLNKHGISALPEIDYQYRIKAVGILRSYWLGADNPSEKAFEYGTEKLRWVINSLSVHLSSTKASEVYASETLQAAGWIYTHAPDDRGQVEEWLASHGPGFIRKTVLGENSQRQHSSKKYGIALAQAIDINYED